MFGLIFFALPAGQDPGAEFFEANIRPLFAEHCTRCHGEKKQKAELRLDRYGSIMAGGEGGVILTPGEVDSSKLLVAVRYEDEFLQMPPREKLSKEEIAKLEEWVEMGAPGPVTEDAGAISVDAFDLEARLAHWAYQPIDDPQVPESSWGHDPLDAFIEGRLLDAGLSHAEETDRSTWLRRVSYAITGLPPSVEELDAFLSDDSPGAHERVVDRLLASPHYGEKWARHWLDLVRYAEGRGHEFDYEIPNAFEYRDYLTRALNADVPYDRFVTEHIAGDLVEEPRLNPEDGFDESVLGTGFWYLGEEVHSPVDIEGDESDRVANQIEVFSRTFLAMSLSCARCHDHKFDPIPTEDYYALAGFLHSSSYRQVLYQTIHQNTRVAGELSELDTTQGAATRAAFTEALQPALEEVDEYLRAAREVLNHDAHLSEDKEPLTAVEEVSQINGLDERTLSAWVVAVTEAHADPKDPLHRWSKLCADEALNPRPEPKESALPANAKPLFSYGDPNQPTAWIQDGNLFGQRARPLGEATFISDPSWPIASISERNAAYVDPTWAKLEFGFGVDGFTKSPAPAAPGALNWNLSGRTLRTPSFAPEHGKLHYLVRGAGRCFASVDSYRIVAGPLHGQVVKRFEDQGGWRWETQDLSRYIGHRVHLEFTPVEGVTDFAVAMIVEGDERPANPPTLIFSPEGEDARALTASLSQGLNRAVHSLANDSFPEGPEGGELAALLNWLLRHPELFPSARRAPTASVSSHLDRRLALLNSIKTRSRSAPAMIDGNSINGRVFIRGNHTTPGEVVSRHLPTPLPGADPITTPGSGRLELAKRLTQKDNPLVTRVIVNRIWHHLFGRGIVSSVDDFGGQGTEPTHPELLDHLTARFMNEGWSIKGLVKDIVLSATYRQSIHGDPRGAELDPDNLLLGRSPIRRLEAEAIRDGALAVAGSLDKTLYGPSVPVHLDSFMEGRGRPGESGPIDGRNRRSIYISVPRNFLSPFFKVFDRPIPFTAQGRRSASNVPAQSLTLMNDPLFEELAERWAKRALMSGPKAPVEIIESLYLEAFSRRPTELETERLQRYLGERDDEEAWADVCHVLINVKEFIYLN